MQHGAEVKDSKGWKALMFSVDSGHGDIARVLLDKEAKADHINHDGLTAADIAAGAERIELQDILETFTGDRGRLRRKQVGGVEQDSEIATLLKNFEMEHLIDVFKRENIDLEVFLLMKEANLSQLCSVGDTKKLLLKQAELHKAEWSRWESCFINASNHHDVMETVSDLLSPPSPPLASSWTARPPSRWFTTSLSTRG